jgi:hypothetical protein
MAILDLPANIRLGLVAYLEMTHGLAYNIMVWINSKKSFIWKIHIWAQKVLNTNKKNPPILAVVHYGDLCYIAFYDCN